MPQFVNRWWGWFQARTGVQQILILLLALVVAVVGSRVIAGLAALTFLITLIALVVQVIRRRPVRALVIVTVAAFVVAVVFGYISTAIYGGPPT